MHAAPTTAPAPPQTAQDLAVCWAARLQRAQEDALDTIHATMLRLAAGIDAPNADGTPADPRTVTQRTRLCLQAARDLLRFKPPTDREQALSPRPTSSKRDAKLFPAAAGAGVSRFGERLSGAPNSPAAQVPAESREPSATSAVSPSPPPSSPWTPRPIDPDLITPQIDPEDARQVRQLVLAGRTLPVELYDKLQRWTRYTQATGLPRPFGFSPAEVEACSPHKPSTS